MQLLQHWIVFLSDNAAQFSEKLLEQLYLVSAAMAIAILCGIPLGILVVKMHRLRTFVLGFSGIVQTIPSLALLAFLLPLFGIGAKPAIIALALYALLPVVRNTVTGLETVPAVNVEAARGLGFTNWQRLWIVELPLALPTIVAGIRIATVISVGVATLAAFIGAGGLGDFINRGLALNSTRLLLLGAVPAALLALLLDFAMGHVELALAKGKNINKRKSYFTLIIVVVLLCLPLILTVCVETLWPKKPHNIVRVATKNFTEQLILGEILTQLIEAKTDLKVKRYFNLGTTEIVHRALMNEQIDMYPEYTGTAYLTILNLPYQGLDTQVLFEKVSSEYAQKFQIKWLPPLGFNNTQALAVRDNFAKYYRLKDINDLLPLSKKIIVGAPPEFVLRPDALPGLQKVYGLHFDKIKQLDPNLMYSAIFEKQVNVIMAFSTDGRIEKYHLKLLRDDKKLFPPYDAAILVRQSVLNEHPELLNVLQTLSGKINDQTMRDLNYQVDLQKRTPAEIARKFLKAKKLI